MPVPQRFPGIRWIRFTLRFGEAITIAVTFALGIAGSVRVWCRLSASCRARPPGQHTNIPGSNAVNGRNNNVIGNEKAGHVSPASGNEGVGEHVRTRSRPGFGPGEIAELVLRTERRKLVSSAGSVFER